METRDFVLVAALCTLLGTSYSDQSQTTLNQQPGGSVMLQCSIPPGGSVLWYKMESDGKMEVAQDAHLTVSDNRYQIQAKNGAYVLKIHPTKESDSGTFICESIPMAGDTHKYTFSLRIGSGGGAIRATAAALATGAVALFLLI